MPRKKPATPPRRSRLAKKTAYQESRVRRRCDRRRPPPNGQSPSRHAAARPRNVHRSAQGQPDHRRVAGQGEDDREVPRLRLPGAGQLRPRPRSARQRQAQAARLSSASTSTTAGSSAIRSSTAPKRAAAKARRSTEDILDELKREADRAEMVYLATDPDREGESIAWHIEEELELDRSGPGASRSTRSPRRRCRRR